MAPFITAKLDTDQVLRFASKLGLSAKELSKAQVTAVNDVAKTTRGRVRKEVRAYLTLPARSVNQRVEVGRKATPTKPEATVVIDRKVSRSGGGASARPTLMSFKGKPKVPRREGKRTKTGKLTKSARAPFTYQIRKGGSRRLLKGGFVQRPRRRFNLQSGGFDALEGEQRAQAFRRQGKARYPLSVPRGPSIAAVYQNPETKIADRVTADARERLPGRFQGQARRQLGRTFKRALT